MLFLYNETLKQRRKSLKVMRAKVERMVREHRLEVYFFMNSLHELHKLNAEWEGYIIC